MCSRLDDLGEQHLHRGARRVEEGNSGATGAGSEAGAAEAVTPGSGRTAWCGRRVDGTTDGRGILEGLGLALTEME